MHACVDRLEGIFYTFCLGWDWPMAKGSGQQQQQWGVQYIAEAWSCNFVFSHSLTFPAYTIGLTCVLNNLATCPYIWAYCYGNSEHSLRTWNKLWNCVQKRLVINGQIVLIIELDFLCVFALPGFKDSFQVSMVEWMNEWMERRGEGVWKHK